MIDDFRRVGYWGKLSQSQSLYLWQPLPRLAIPQKLIATKDRYQS